MERAVDRGPRRELARGKAAENLVEGERVVAELGRLDVGERGGRRLVVPLDRGRLAAAGRVAVADLDLDDVRLVLGPAGDRERLGKPQRDDPSGDVHAARLALPRP